MHMPQDQNLAPTPRRHFLIFKSSAAALLCFYLLLMVAGIIMGWLHVLGILPVLILSASVFGLMHAAYRMVLDDDDDHLSDLHSERGGTRKKIVFFIDN